MKNDKETGAFDELDKQVKPSRERLIPNSPTPLVCPPIQPDWAKIAKAVLKIIEPQVPVPTYKMIVILTDLILKKRSKFGMTLSFIFISSVQVAGIYELYQLIKFLIIKTF